MADLSLLKRGGVVQCSESGQKAANGKNRPLLAIRVQGANDCFSVSCLRLYAPKVGHQLGKPIAYLSTRAESQVETKVHQPVGRVPTSGGV